MDDCPVGMDIANMMQALNRRAIYGQQLGQNWYNFATNTGKPKASECIQCGQCEEACPQHIAIIEELENCVDYFE
jgi:predicted aldo/keto reductase-like oxidoreductase